MDVKKIYYPDVGGAVRVFLSENENDIFVVNLNNSLSELEKNFIKKCAPHLGFRKNIKNFTELGDKIPLLNCE